MRSFIIDKISPYTIHAATRLNKSALLSLCEGSSIKFHTGMAYVVAVIREEKGEGVGTRKSERKEGDSPLHRPSFFLSLFLAPPTPPPLTPGYAGKYRDGRWFNLQHCSDTNVNRKSNGSPVIFYC